MNKTSSDNYDFYYLNGSIAERDIDKIIKFQQDCFKEICEKLNISPEIRIQYYLVNSPELVGEIYGDNEPCNGFAQAPNEIYAVYNDKIRCVGHHEDAHILSYTINRPKSNFIREGLAMFFDKLWWDKTNEEWVKTFILEDKYVNIEKLLQDDIFLSCSDAITYPIAGAFTRFLIDNYGIKKYILLYKYKGENFAKKINEVYLKELEKIEDDFILTLKD